MCVSLENKLYFISFCEFVCLRVKFHFDSLKWVLLESRGTQVLPWHETTTLHRLLGQHPNLCDVIGHSLFIFQTHPTHPLFNKPFCLQPGLFVAVCREMGCAEIGVILIYMIWLTSSTVVL